MTLSSQPTTPRLMIRKRCWRSTDLLPSRKERQARLPAGGKEEQFTTFRCGPHHEAIMVHCVKPRQYRDIKRRTLLDLQYDRLVVEEGTQVRITMERW